MGLGYFGGGVCESKARLDGKIAFITGANTGIGKETALDFAKRGAKVYMGCRDLQRANNAREEVIRDSGNQNVHVVQLDLTDLESVRNAVKAFPEESLNILVNNAGVMMTPFLKTKDGFEMQMGTNHLGHFLLTNLLLEHLKAGAPSRVVVVSSLYHKRTNGFDFDNMNAEKDYDRGGAYAQSKLANILFARQLAKILEGTGVTTYSLHPGVIRTELGRHIPVVSSKAFQFLFSPLGWLFLKSPWQGAQTSIYCSIAEELADVSGRYYGDCREEQPAAPALDDAAAERLWSVSSEMVKLNSAGVGVSAEPTE